MVKASNITAQNTTTICPKIHRSRQIISRKIIAFDEILNLEKTKRSARSASELLEIPNSTMQSWRKRTSTQKIPKELADFFQHLLVQIFFREILLL
jgi:hypothetical protein